MMQLGPCIEQRRADTLLVTLQSRVFTKVYDYCGKWNLLAYYYYTTYWYIYPCLSYRQQCIRYSLLLQIAIYIKSIDIYLSILYGLLSIYPSTYIIYLSTYRSVYLSVCLSVYLSLYFFIINEIFWSIIVK